MCVCVCVLYQMRLLLSLGLILSVLIAVSAYKAGPKKTQQPVGKPISEEAYKLHVNKGKTHHDDDGVSKKHKPAGHHQVPQPEVTLHVAVLQEQSQSDVKRYTHHLGCHYGEPIGHWDNTKQKPIKFIVNPTGSGTTAEDVERTFDLASRVMHNAAPGLKRQMEFTHLPTGHDMKPSSHQPVNVTRIPNGINEIGWSPRAYCDDKLLWINGELHENHYKGNIILEAYIWVRTATKEIIEVDISFANNANVDWHHFSDDNLLRGGYTYNTIVVADNRFDSCGSAVWALGHGLGLQHTESHTHTMHGVQARGTMHKRSLECGDIAGLKHIYP